MHRCIIAGAVMIGLLGCSGAQEDEEANNAIPVEILNNGGGGDTSDPPNDTAGETTDGGGMCMDVTVYLDEDGDGVGVEDDTTTACLLDGESPDNGYARRVGDCADDDPIAYVGSPGVCGDNVDDNCDGEDESCPASQPMNLDIPSWECQDDAPPANVVAWARFEDGGEYFKPNGCFVFFEGAEDAFFVQRVGVTPAEECTDQYGCVCPSEGNWPSFDRRLYAMTVSGDVAECPTIALTDHAGESQPVSNNCRKYLYQLHGYDMPINFVAGSMNALNRRLDNFGTVEIACLEDAPHDNLPFASLLTAPIQRNADFVEK